MAVKGVNKFEEHVEKIVLAAAAAGAVFMAYLAFQPVTIDGTDVGPKDVEPRLADQLGKLKGAADRVAASQPHVPDLQYPQEYVKLAQSDPIDDPKEHIQIVSAAVPNFGPRNSPLAPSTVGPVLEGKVVAPDPVAPEDLSAELWEGVVANPLPLGPDGKPVATQPGSVLATHDQSAAVVEGFIPIGEMRVQLEKLATDPERGIREQQLRTPEIYRIKVQRRERTANGWGDWADVQPTKAATPPTPVDWKNTGAGDIPNVLQVTDNEFKQIVIPDFFPDANGVPIPAPILSRQPSQQIKSETSNLQSDLQKAVSAEGGAAAPAAPPPPPPAAGPGTAAPAFPADAKSLQALGVVPFAFWDDTVVPGHVYQFRVEVDFVNPLYQYNTMGLAKPALRDVPVLAATHKDENGKDTPWWTISTPVRVNSDLAFYIQGTGLGAPTGGTSTPVTARVFKKNNGKWYWNDFNSRPGEEITGQIRLVNTPGNPSMQVNTGYTLVAADLSEGGSNVHVVLKDPLGNLETRDSTVDKDDPNNRALQARSEKLQAATSTAPAAQPGEAGTQPGRGPLVNPRPTGTRPSGTRPAGR